MNKLTRLLLLLIIFNSADLIAQRKSDPTLLSRGYHTGNRVGITFYNDGQIGGINTGIDIRGEWPLGSGENYIGDMIPLIGVEFKNRLGLTLQSVIISRGPRRGQFEEKSPVDGHFWGWNPVPGFRNPNYSSIAMSHLPQSWPVEGWNDPIAGFWKDADGKTQWFGYFGRGITNADQESFFEADDHWDDEFNSNFSPDASDPSRKGMGLRLRQRGFQWSSFLAEDAIFWLYDISNDGTTVYRKANFATIVGTLAGGDGDSQDDLGYFDINDWVTYSWDSDGIGNRGQKVGYVGYAFLESPGNPYDGIDNDNDSQNPSSPTFQSNDFNTKTFNAGDKIVLINPDTYERTIHIVKNVADTVYSLGTRFIIVPGVTQFREGHIASTANGVAIPDITANDGIDNDLDGLIDENQAVHYQTRIQRGLQGLKYKNFITGVGLNDLLIDERRDNDTDENGNWDRNFDDVGQDGLGPNDDGYPGPDIGEGDGRPTQGEPNFGKTDTGESDQIGLTGFNFFELASAPDLSIDSLVWRRMTPGRFDIVPPTPQDGDFIYSSGYFPLAPKTTERFSVSILMGEDYRDVITNKKTVQKIYDSGYKFPQAPRKPKIHITQKDGNVVIYWDGSVTENSRDFVTKTKDFEGYKIYRSTDANFRDARIITNALGVLSFDQPIAQNDLKNGIKGFYYPSKGLLEAYGGLTYYLGDDTGIVNRFVDSTVVAGVTYYYAVCAFDRGDESLEIFPEENSKFIFRTNTGQIITDDNTGYITPGRRPLGYVPASSTPLVKSTDFIGTGSAFLEIIDDAAIKHNYKYEVVFEDSALQAYTKNWSLLDLQTPDTVYIPITRETKIVKPTESINLPAGIDTIIVNGRKIKIAGNSYTAPFDTLINKSKIFYGLTPIRDGFRIQLLNDLISIDTTRSGFEGYSSPTPPKYLFQVFTPSNVGPDGSYAGVNLPNDYVIEFSNTIVRNSVADTLYPRISSNIIPARPANFRVRNLTTGKEVDFVYFRTGTLSTVHNIYFKERIGNVVRRTWRINVFYPNPNTPLEQSGTFSIRTFKPFNHKDKYSFEVKGAEINTEVAKNDLDKIKVVPNPYVVTHDGEQRLLSFQTSGRGEREIRFTRIPPGSKISVFTVRGELIKTLFHENLYVGDVYWNLRSEENIEVAYGVYVFVVEAPGVGTKVGKFALIK